MAEKSITRYQGILLPDFTFDQLAATGAGATDSKYTQAGARPGVPDPSRDDGLTLVASGEQEENGEVEVYIKRSGATGAEEAGFLWRDVAGGDSTSQWKGWDPYQVITGWESINAETTSSPTTIAFYCQGIQTQAGTALFLETQSTATKTVRLQEFDPIDGTWTAINGPTLEYETSGGCLLQLPSGRILLFLEAQSQRQIDVYSSSDEGATWAEYSLAALRVDLGNNNDKQIIRAAYSGGDVSLIVADPSVADKWWQYASDDEGLRFSLVDEDWGVSGSTPYGFDLVGLPDGGGFVMSYFDDDGVGPYFFKTRKITSAWDEYTGATPVNMVSVSGVGWTTRPTEPCTSLWLDEDGYLFCAYVEQDSVRSVVLVRSDDEAASWEALGHAPIEHANDAIPKRFTAVPIAGRLAFLTRWETLGSTYDPYSAAVVWMGGYGTHTVPAASDVSAFESEWGAFGDGAHITYHSGDRSSDGGQWLPFTLPSSQWTGSGAGSMAMNAAGDATITDAYTYYAQMGTADAADGSDAVFGEFILKPDAGTGKMELRLIDDPTAGTPVMYDIRISLTSAGTLALYDINAGAGAGTDVTGLSAGWLRVRVALDGSGNVRTWYAREEHITAWTEGPQATGLTSSSSSVSNRCTFGTVTTGDDVDFKFVGFCFWAYRWAPEDLNTKIGEAWSNPDSLHPRSVPGRATVVFDGLKVRGTGGLARKGDKYTIATRYDYAASLAFPDVEPSPGRAWRSSAVTEHLFVQDRESVIFSINADTSYMDSTAIAAFWRGANFKQFYLEGYNGSSWVQLGEGDASHGLSSLGFDRSGSRVRPSSGTSTAPSYVFNNVHVGDTFDLGAGEVADRYRKIGHNAEGAWTAGTARTPVITLDGCNGSEVGSGTGAIWSRDFGVVVHDHTATYERYRVRIPAQSTADGYFTGTLVMGPVYPFGHQHDHGWTVAKERPFRDTVIRSGRRRRKAVGPRRRVLDVGWTSTVINGKRAYLNQTTELADHIVAGASEPTASVQDLVSQVEGLVEAAGGEPIIFLRRVVSGSASEKVARREDFVYGRIMSDTQRDNVRGDESSTPWDRLNTIRIEEEV